MYFNDKKKRKKTQDILTNDYGNSYWELSDNLVSFMVQKNLKSRTSDLLMFGVSGQGKAYHPWDCLNRCKCGSFPWMKGRKIAYESGPPYRVVCLGCARHTQKGNYEEVVAEWNNQICIR